MGSGVLGCFFFQAEDGIRDYKVTGVQTCALPIWSSCVCSSPLGSVRSKQPARQCEPESPLRARDVRVQTPESFNLRHEGRPPIEPRVSNFGSLRLVATG